MTGYIRMLGSHKQLKKVKDFVSLVILKANVIVELLGFKYKISFFKGPFANLIPNF